jgi:hypothetical protein
MYYVLLCISNSFGLCESATLHRTNTFIRTFIASTHLVCLQYFSSFIFECKWVVMYNRVLSGRKVPCWMNLFNRSVHGVCQEV